MTGRSIRVLLAEDSVTAAELITAILHSDSEIQVIGRAADGAEAVRLTKELRPDLVLIDVQMPRMNGLAATKKIMIECPSPIVVISAWLDRQELDISMEALRAGALAVVEKPVGPTAPSFSKHCASLISTVKAMADVKTVRHWPEKLTTPVTLPKVEERIDTAIRIVTIAASTGGPQALSKLASHLTGSFPAPIIVIQHIGAQFMSSFAQWLGSCTAMRVKIAEAGEQICNGTIYLPAQDHHLEVRRGGKIALTKAPPVGGFRPAANVLFESAAEVYGPSVLAVILTGMGSDGAIGACKIKAAGGYVVAQDEASSIVFGMPKAAIERGCVNQTMSLGEIAAKLSRLNASAQPGA